MKPLTAPLTSRQCDGLDCVVCGGSDGAMVPTGDYAGRVALFAHEPCLAASRTPAGAGPPSVLEGSSGRPDHVFTCCLPECGKPGRDAVGLSLPGTTALDMEELGFCSLAHFVTYVRRRWIEAQ